MFARLALTFLVAVATASALSAESRAWKSADGVRTVQGEFVSRTATSVTIRNGAGTELVIDLPKLHADERKWLDVNHPLAAENAAADPVPDSAAVFDTLKFGDGREEALAKLKASKIVEMTSDETFIGRSGLNGVFRTRRKIGTLYGFLYFDWTEGGKLKELNLQTEPRPDTDYKTELEPSWKEFVELLGALYGKPVSKAPFPSLSSLPDGAFSPTHLWPLEAGGSALLGAAREGKNYQLVVRFTRKSVQPVAFP